jgi:hypothetical protein
LGSFPITQSRSTRAIRVTGARYERADEAGAPRIAECTRHDGALPRRAAHAAPRARRPRRARVPRDRTRITRVQPRGEMPPERDSQPEQQPHSVRRTVRGRFRLRTVVNIGRRSSPSGTFATIASTSATSSCNVRSLPSRRLPHRPQDPSRRSCGRTQSQSSCARYGTTPAGCAPARCQPPAALR